MCMPGVHGSQKRSPDPLELKLWIVMSHLLGAGIKPGSSAKTSAHNPSLKFNGPIFLL